MKKIKISKKLSLNKTSISKLNDADQANVVGGKDVVVLTVDKLCGDTRGCACGTSVVNTCGIYCADDHLTEM